MCYPLTDEDKQWAWDTKTKTKAASLLNNIQSSEFLVSFHTSHYFFAYTKDVARQLQGPSKDVLSAYQDIGNAISCICDAQAQSKECLTLTCSCTVSNYCSHVISSYPPALHFSDGDSKVTGKIIARGEGRARLLSFLL